MCGGGGGGGVSSMSSTCAVTYVYSGISIFLDSSPYSLLYESERVSTIGNKCEKKYIYMYTHVHV